MKIGIIIGSIREGRNAEAVARWVAASSVEHRGVEFELLDLKAFEIPLVTASVWPGAANREYECEGVRRWSAAVDGCDGFVFVTPEYHHGVPGAFKNAVDALEPEWEHKSVAFVSYGLDLGIRAVEQWRQIVVKFDMVDVRAQVSLSLSADFDADGTFAPRAGRVRDRDRMLGDLLAATTEVDRPFVVLNSETHRTVTLVA